MTVLGLHGDSLEVTDRKVNRGAAFGTVSPHVDSDSTRAGGRGECLWGGRQQDDKLKWLSG